MWGCNNLWVPTSVKLDIDSTPREESISRESLAYREPDVIISDWMAIFIPGALDRPR